MSIRLELRRPDDMHVHLREGDMLRSVVAATAGQFARALVMPNTTKPVLTARDVLLYRSVIRLAVDQLDLTTSFEPLMTIKITPETTPQIICDARNVGVVAGKLYPDGVTTNSAGGVRDFRSLYPTYAAMQDAGMVLCLHGEMPGSFSLDREADFLPVLTGINRDFPELKIVLEHVSTELAVQWVMGLSDKVAATITVHHLLLTLDDIIGDKLRPHNFCKPVAKTPRDRTALIAAATSGNPKFFLGTDSAPHTRLAKECDGGAAGVYTAPVAMPLLAQIFTTARQLDRLEDYTSRFGAEFYGLPLNDGTLTLIHEADESGNDSPVSVFRGIVPLDWRLATSHEGNV